MKSNFLSKKILSRKIPYLIAEIGINHNGNINLAKKMILSAKKNGADCVKFQKFIANDYISRFAVKANYQKKIHTKKHVSQLEIIKSCELNINQMNILKKFSKKIGIDFLCTPFEITSLDELLKIKIEAIKISSCNLTNRPFLVAAAKSKLPILLSTGMANFNEVEKAVSIIKKFKNPLLVFQCTSNYPSKIENANLSVLKTYKKKFKCPVGFSDHTNSIIPAIVAVSQGAVVIEKHFTLSKNLPGIDQRASIEPAELNDLAKAIKDASLSLGSSKKKRSKEENDTLRALRRSLVAAINIKKNQILKKSMVAIKRPGTGLETKYINKIVGLRLKKDVIKDQIFKMKDFH
tara:strand:- start:571 stop:1617 length:1047 start_codon:yes stop_codon:yes gene_type:complete